MARSSLLIAHLCAGLLLFVYATVAGITGAVLVFHDEITFLFDKNLHSNPTPVVVSPDDVLENVRNSSHGWRPISLTWPNSDCPYWMTYAVRGREAREIYSSPQSGAVVEERDPHAGFPGWVEQLHVNFLLGANGRTVNGIGAMSLLFLVASGIFLWWSGGGRRTSRLFGSWNTGWRRWTWTLHQGTGVASAAFIIVTAFTGGYFIWTQAYIHAVEHWWGRTQPVATPRHPKDTPLLGIAELARIAERTLPGLPIHRIQIVDRPDSSVRITLREGNVQEFHLVSTVVLDPATGGILQTIRLQGRPAGDSILGWFAALHMGVFAGLPGKLLWSALSLSLPLLGGTGVLMWWRRIVEPRLRTRRRSVPA